MSRGTSEACSSVFLEPTRSPGDLAWLASRAGITAHPGLEAIKATDKTGRIVGMVGFDGWTPASISFHVAVDYPAALRPLIRPAFDIAFNRLQKHLVLCTVLSTNRRSLKLVEHLGFQRIFEITDGWDIGAHLAIYEMRRRDCRWLKPEREVTHGRRRQELSTSTNGV
jgi:RimJ/RimL family protein N-acetyltransferase